MAILVDETSYSASEVFAGGMQAAGRARVFGARTPGGALPALMRKLPNGDVLEYAIADFVTVSGERIEGRGVVPDERVERSRAGRRCRRGCCPGRGGPLGRWRSAVKPAFRALSAVLAALALIASGSLLLEAQSPKAPSAKPRQAAGKLPGAVEILSRYTRAVGGERVIRQYRSRRAIGRFELRAQGISGPIEILAAAPDRTLIRITLAGAWRAAAGLRRRNRLVGGSRGRPPGAVRP